MLPIVKSAFADIRRQPVLSIVSLIGTALSIFLIMMVVMIQAVKVEPFAPESNRDRFLHCKYVSVQSSSEGWMFNSCSSPLLIRNYLYPISSAEAVTAYSSNCETSTLSSPEGKIISADRLDTDAAFWHVFDFNFKSGRAFDQSDFEAGMPVAVISSSLARRLFDSEDVVGREFQINFHDFRVCGVVSDVSTLCTKAYAQIWIPYTVFGQSGGPHSLFGGLSATILAPSRNDFPIIKREFEQRMKALSDENDCSVINRNRPYDQFAETCETIWANTEPDVKSARRDQTLIYLILLIVPALNLSEMTRSRMRHRYSEIGVRRAFGATRWSVIRSVLAENLVLTLAGGLLGLILSMITGYLFGSSLFVSEDVFNPLTGNDLVVDFHVLFHWSTFGLALLFCFLLNLLSAGIPAWRASRINVVNALSGFKS